MTLLGLRGLPRHGAVWVALVAIGALLDGCANPPPAPHNRLFAVDFSGAARSCSAPSPALEPGRTTQVKMQLANDGGWCAITVRGAPYSAGLLVTPPAHGEVYIHPVGDDMRIDYTPSPGFTGADAFEVKLIPGDPVLQVSVAVTPR